MSALKELFSCCFPEHKNDLVITNAEEKVEFSLSQITSVISKKEDKLNEEGKQVNGSDKKQSLLLSQGTAIFNTSSHQPQALSSQPNHVQQEPYPTNRIIEQDDISKAPILTVKDISSKNIFTNNKTEIIINAGGLEMGGTRKEKDGIVFFGIGNSTKGNESFGLDVELQNINSSGKEVATPNPFLFVICYIKETNSYQLKVTLEESSISRNVFIKMAPTMELPILQTEILSLGSIMLSITPGVSSQIEVSIVNNQLCRKTFSALDKVITIGRSKTCSVSFDNLKGFSKIQSTLYYNEAKKHWVLKDGSGTKNSMNGTWLFGINSYQICSDMIIEVNHTQMQLIVTPQKDM